MRGRLWHWIRLVGPLWWAVALLVATAGVWQRFEAIRMGRQIDATQRRIAELTRVRDRLLAETARLSARERIEPIAINHLGLRPTNKGQVRSLKVDTLATARWK